MNLQQYANHRKSLGLRGQSHVAVINAINDGRLTPPAVERNGQRWQINAVLADVQWAERTDATESGSRGGPPRPIGREATAAAVAKSVAASMGQGTGGPSLAVSKQVKAAYDAKMAELEYKQRNGEMGRIEDMKREAFSLAKQIREGVLGIVPRVSADLAAISDQFEVERLLEGELLVALRSLADG